MMVKCMYTITFACVIVVYTQKEMRCQFSLSYVNVESVLPQIKTVSSTDNYIIVCSPQK